MLTLASLWLRAARVVARGGLSSSSRQGLADPCRMCVKIFESSAWHLEVSCGRQVRIQLSQPWSPRPSLQQTMTFPTFWDIEVIQVKAEKVKTLVGTWGLRFARVQVKGLGLVGVQEVRFGDLKVHSGLEDSRALGGLRALKPQHFKT